jgi:hypothetical protein
VAVMPFSSGSPVLDGHPPLRNGKPVRTKSQTKPRSKGLDASYCPHVATSTPEITRTGFVVPAFQRSRYASPEVLTCPYFSGIAPLTRTFELPESASRASEKSALQSCGAKGDDDVQIASGSLKSVRTT